MASYTTYLNLKKPAGSENVSIGDINNNMDLVDTAYHTLSNQIATENYGTMTVSSLETSLATLAASMANNSFRNFKVNISTASGSFANGVHLGTIKRYDNNYYCVDVQGISTPTEFIQGVCYNGTWSWNSLNDHIAKLDAVNFANTRTDIKAELTDVNDYTFLNSGYLVICAKSSGYVRLSMNNTLVTHDIPANSWNSLFVFKGMKAHITSATAGNVEYAFINPVP